MGTQIHGIYRASTSGACQFLDIDLFPCCLETNWNKLTYDRSRQCKRQFAIRRTQQYPFTGKKLNDSVRLRQTASCRYQAPSSGHGALSRLVESEEPVLLYGPPGNNFVAGSETRNGLNSLLELARLNLHHRYPERAQNCFLGI